MSMSGNKRRSNGDSSSYSLAKYIIIPCFRMLNMLLMVHGLSTDLRAELTYCMRTRLVGMLGNEH